MHNQNGLKCSILKKKSDKKINSDSTKKVYFANMSAFFYFIVTFSNLQKYSLFINYTQRKISIFSFLALKRLYTRKAGGIAKRQGRQYFCTIQIILYLCLFNNSLRMSAFFKQKKQIFANSLCLNNA